MDYRKHLISTYPEMETLLLRCSDFQPLESRKDSVLIAVVRTVIGQMLSRRAAQTIYQRVASLIEKDPQFKTITHEDLLKQGVSNSKAKTILNFAKLYGIDPEKYENWSNLEYPILHDEVCKVWGISTWTASILAIFYFAHENVFPYQDGTIKKALRLLEERDIKIDPEQSSPYKTYLAISLWKLVDEGLI